MVDSQANVFRIARFRDSNLFGRFLIYSAAIYARVQPLIEGHFALHDAFGMGDRTIQRIVKRVANRARISRPVSPHVLRHTFAVTAVQRNISLPSLQRLLGHDHLGTTQIYLNLSPEEVIREFNEKW